MALHTYTDYCKGLFGVNDGFTGVVYSDTGRLNYAAVVNGRMLQNKRGMNRWFGSAEAAQKAIEAED
ncbi:hypothetical protein HAP48_0042915 [Bradyrhizobium septentrionale]|uniref:Uncharacterized protein n=1 Tax=Bradyrhizobium septentrionale TaxID=1404411 RepID=A0A973W3E0_9BRAD|nr:hypothetical protein [Bradyrhizobium septentrionale]UGY15210.1 hypothetical protein HAP48_0042915 [Bradyrhizobium septentrionale]